jgi:hypothetical protein
MNVRTMDGANISMDVVGNKLEIEFDYAGSKGSFNLLLGHAKILAKGADTLLTKFGSFLAMDPGLKKREPDIRAVVAGLKKTAGV